MTQTFMESITAEATTSTATGVPAPVVEDTRSNACAIGHAWCNGDCADEADTSDFPSWRNDQYHAVVIAELPVLRFGQEGWKEDYLPLLVRHDETECDDSQPLIMADFDDRACYAMTAEQARKHAAWLMNAADLIDPLPAGAIVTTAVQVRIGDELLTTDGWQKVTGLLFDVACEQASVFTSEQTMDDSDGWDLSFNDPVKVRRPVHGSCAIQFVEPIR